MGRQDHVHRDGGIGQIWAEQKGAGEGLKYKVYLEGEEECANQQKVPDNQARTFEQLTANDIVYVVVSNVQYQPNAFFEYVVRVEPGG